MIDIEEAIKQYNIQIEYGSYFNVVLFNDIVIKIPAREAKLKYEKVREISKMQNQITHISGVLPCLFKKGCIIMPKAPGVRADKLNENQWEYVKQKRNEILKEIGDSGYKIDDLKSKDNLFYDEEKDQVYIIDYHKIKKK